MTQRIYDGDGFRRIRPSERGPGMTELRLPNGRTCQCLGVSARVDAALNERARANG